MTIAGFPCTTPCEHYGHMTPTGAGIPIHMPLLRHLDNTMWGTRAMWYSASRNLVNLLALMVRGSMPEGSRCQSQSISSIVSFSQRVPCWWIALFRATIDQYRNQRFLARRQETFEIEWKHRGKKINSYRSDVLFLFLSIDLSSIIFIVKKRSARRTKDLWPIRQ